MDTPDLVTSTLEGERVVSRVDLGGDGLFVTPTRTLVYRDEGLLSDESVSAFPHDVDQLEVREGRRKATVRMTDLDGTREFSVPPTHLEDVLASVLWGVLHAEGVLGDDQRVQEAYRFSELTFVVTDVSLVKHVGSAVWDDDYEVFPFEDLTDLYFEEGTVTTSLVLELGDRRERVKTPREEARIVRRGVEKAVFDFHGVDSLASLRETISPDDGTDTATDRPLESELTGLLEQSRDSSTQSTDTAGPGTDLEVTDETVTALAERVEAVERAIRRQNELIEDQQAIIERLVEELRGDT